MADEANPGATPTPTFEQRLAARAGEVGAPIWTVGWCEAIFEHYRVTTPEALRERIPTGLALDQHDGSAWLSVVSFRMTAMRWRDRVPLPFASTYPQVNVRVYVAGPDGTPGVFFLRNLVSNRLAARAGRMLYGMPYVYRPVTLTRGDTVSCEASLEDRTHSVTGRPGDELTGHEDDPASLLFFLAERYPLFSDRRGHLSVARMLHPPWPLQRLEDVEQSHGLLDALDLADVVEPHPDVQCSPGVRVRMWPSRDCAGS